MARGDAAAARDELRAGSHEPTRAVLPVLAREICTEPHLVRLALAARDEVLADAAVSDAEQRASGWEALTESELEVVRLVASGLTNRDAAERLFVSPHTVGTHLRHVFTKLNVNSRVELTRIAMERDRGA